MNMSIFKNLTDKIEKWLDKNLPEIDKKAEISANKIIKTGEKVFKKMDDALDVAAKKIDDFAQSKDITIKRHTTANHYGKETEQKTTSTNTDKQDNTVIPNGKEKKIPPEFAYSEGEIANLNYMPLLIVAKKLNLNVVKNEISYQIDNQLFRFHVADNSWYDFQNHESKIGTIDFVNTYLKNKETNIEKSREGALKMLNDIYFDADYQASVSNWIQEEQKLDSFTRKPKRKP